jgi:hypothetical protein
MTHVYSDPTRENEPTALPDVEVFYDEAWAKNKSGAWFYWYCFPDCLPDSEPIGPYPTEEVAIKAVHDYETVRTEGLPN